MKQMFCPLADSGPIEYAMVISDHIDCFMSCRRKLPRLTCCRETDAIGKLRQWLTCGVMGYLRLSVARKFILHLPRNWLPFKFLCHSCAEKQVYGLFAAVTKVALFVI
jgi:hypothetical protein